MSTKRKRPIEEVENSQPGGTPVSVKKKKGRMSKEEKQVVTAELRKARGVFDVLRTPRGGSRDVCEHFVRTPSRRQDPQYYKDVKSPIDLTRIQQKINNEEYRTFDEFCEDVELLVENSKNYYKENSEEHKDAMALFDIYKEAKNRVEKGIPFSDDEDDGASTAASSIEQAHSISSGRVSRLSNVSEESIEPLWVDDILCGILELTDKSGRLIAPPFRVLLPKEEFPIYYDKIKNPIDLKRIAQKGRAGEYKVMSELGADIRLLCKNAQQFSGKNSEIYKDASAIVDFYKEKSEQVMEKGVHNRRREKCVNQVNQLLAQEASNMDVDYSEDSEEDEDMKDSTDPLWKLYWLLRNEPDPKSKGTLLSDPFVELPAKSCYPDYYDEIKQPMSFFMIHKILKRGGYSTLMDLLKDCMQIFANACEYNVEGSSVYVAAKKLETLALKKAAELQPSLDLTFFETKPVIQVINTTPKVKGTPKTLKIKAEPLDSSSDEKDSYGTPPPSKKKWTPRKQRPISTGMTAEHLAAPGRPGRKSMDELMLRYRQKLVVFWDLLYNFKEGAYWPVGAFMELPRMKEYPDYYDVIAQPIDMREIRRKIETNKYESSSHLMADFELMFNNARTFNDPGSQIANDASRLENMVITAHGNTKDAPIESPLALKEKFGWLRTKLTEPRRRRGENGLQTPTSNTSFFNGSNGISDDDSSNSSIRSPAPMSHLPIPKSKGKNDKNKMETMISRLPPDQQRMWRLFNHLRDYHDEEGRKLSTAFLRLPTREEYPDYYEVIKKPMDMQRIQQRLNGQGYSSWTDIVADFSLMLDNACKYNETDSQIYKDAVSLQRVLLEKKMELGATDDSMPRVQVEIRNMFMTIFHSVFSKKDSKGRCRSDSFADLPDILKSKGIGIDEQPFTFDQIKRNIDKSRYRRLDRFQKDFFDLFEKARQHSAPDSKLFEDAEELQLVFVRERDTHCKAILVSDAYGIVEGKVREECEILRKQKLKNSEHTQELERRESTDDIAKEAGDVELTDLTIGDHVYTTPCYVYVARTDDNPRGPPHIMRVERIFKNQNGDNMVRGLWVYRPNETLHLPKRRFLEKEVFLTPFQDNALAERLQGPCQVVSLKTYVNNEIADVEPKDLYVCESKYLGKPRYFAKIKNWEYADEDAKLKMEKREKPLDPVSVPLSYVKAENEVEDGQSSQTSSSSEEDDRLRESVILDIERIEVRSSQEPDADGRSYFCQMLTKAGRHYACGDFVLVFNPQRPYCDVMRIDKLWREADGNEWFSGGWFARPSDVTHDPGRMFYVREVFAVYQSDQTRRVDDIQNHCAVLTTKEYIKQRPTEVPECDVFVCENKIAGKPVPNGEVSSIFPTQLHNKETDEVPTGEPLHIDSCVLLKRIKTYKNGNQVVDPELFLFKQPIAMEKEMSPLLKNDVAVPLDPLDMDMLDEDTDGAESVTSSKPEMNNWLANQPKLTAKSKSGYILFSAEIRKRIMHENPEAGFGEVSKIVGIEWKKLSEEQKRQYEVRAEFIASERQKQEAARAAVKDQLLPGQIRVYHCKWANCDSQFDQENGLYEHIVQHHTSQIILDSDNQYVCMWITCLRNRKDGKPFPSLPRLHRHMKEKHVNSSVRNLYQNQIGRNFYKLVTTPGPSGENYQLVHLPHARGMTGAPSGQQQNQSTPAPHLNGHPTAVVVNGDHHHGPPHIHHQTPHHPAQVQYSHQQPSSSHHPQQGHPSSSQHVPQAEAGRLVVKMPPGAEPVFVHMPSSFMSRRVLHSESYLRYIESLSNNRQRTVSHWERNLNSNYRNMNPQHQQGQKKNLPVHWIKQDTAGRNVVPEDDVVKALWRLRDQMLESSLGMSTERNYQGLL